MDSSHMNATVILAIREKGVKKVQNFLFYSYEQLNSYETFDFVFLNKQCIIFRNVV